MGFFKSIGRAIGKGVEKVGGLFGSRKLERIGRDIQNACAETVSRERSYEKETANIYSTARLNEILVSFSEGYYQQATEIENASIASVEGYYDDIIELLEQTSDKTKMDANLRRLKRDKSKIKRNMKDAIKNPLSKKMSLDDPQCLQILKMDAGEEKRKAMTRFSQEIINEALDNLSKQVRQTLDEQMEWIEDYLSNVLEEQEKEFYVLKNKFDEMLQEGHMKEQSQEQICMVPLIVLNLTEKIEQLLA